MCDDVTEGSDEVEGRPSLEGADITVRMRLSYLGGCRRGGRMATTICALGRRGAQSDDSVKAQAALEECVSTFVKCGTANGNCIL